MVKVLLLPHADYTIYLSGLSRMNNVLGTIIKKIMIKEPCVVHHLVVWSVRHKKCCTDGYVGPCGECATQCQQHGIHRCRVRWRWRCGGSWVPAQQSSESGLNAAPLLSVSLARTPDRGLVTINIASRRFLAPLSFTFSTAVAAVWPDNCAWCLRKYCIGLPVN